MILHLPLGVCYYKKFDLQEYLTVDTCKVYVIYVKFK